jgi:hypothetical protein
VLDYFGAGGKDQDPTSDTLTPSEDAFRALLFAILNGLDRRACATLHRNGPASNSKTGRNNQMDDIRSEEDMWRTGYFFALLLLVLLGSALIVIGVALFPPSSLPREALVGIGMSMAPSAIVAALFRVFLFKEVQYQLTSPVLKEVKERLGPEIQNQVTSILGNYREEIGTLRALRDAGVIRPYRRREMALKDFASAIDGELSEIVVVGSSLKGVLLKEGYKEIRDKLKFKVTTTPVTVKFLLTHPVVADLRASQEARRFMEIGAEIIETLGLLQDWGVPPDNVRLYKGTPTCFGIKTQKRMLLNPYPYGAVSYDSPCLIVETTEDHPSYFYDEFDKSHFRAWDTDVATRISGYDEIVNELRNKLPMYAELVGKMFAS